MSRLSLPDALFCKRRCKISKNFPMCQIFFIFAHSETNDTVRFTGIPIIAEINSYII